MTIVLEDSFEIVRDQDVIPFRNRVKELSTRISMSIIDQTKLITGASELVRNMFKYAGGGKVVLQILSLNDKSGVRLTFKDQGPGIVNIPLAMQDGYSTGKSLGLGLPGTKRLLHEFAIDSTPGKGTTVIVTHWKNGR